MNSRIHISSFVGLTIVAWLLALWAQGQPVLSLDFLKPFGIVVGVIVGISTVFVRWAWAWRIFRGWYVNRPDLRGTWKVTLASDWIDPKTEKGIPPIQGFMVIRQTLTSLSVRLMTSESRSHSIAYSLTKKDDELFRLAVVYRNEPDIELQGATSEIHHGSFWVEALGKGPDALKGHYWTDRKTRGALHCAERIFEYCDSFEAAVNQFTNTEQDGAGNA